VCFPLALTDRKIDLYRSRKTIRRPAEGNKEINGKRSTNHAGNKLQLIKTHLADPHSDVPVNQDGLSTSVLETVVSNNNDAMNILFEAALQESNEPSQNISTTDNSRLVAPEPTNAEVLRIWNACRFVRMGWFSAQEAVVLINLQVYTFYQMLGAILTSK
jgi:hypothetical protein